MAPIRGKVVSPRRRTKLCIKEGSDLYAEDVEGHLAVLPEVTPTTEDVKIEDLHVGDPSDNTQKEIGRLRSIIWHRRHLLIGKGSALPPAAKGGICDIDVGNAKPTDQRVRKVAPQFREKLFQLIKGLFSAKIIKHSTSPWASPIVVIIKKNGIDIKLCIDYRLVNSLTRLMIYPMALINDLLDDLDKVLWYCSLDMANGFWVVSMTDRAREISAFTTPFGLFEWNRMPFGLKNAPQLYQRLLDNALYDFVKITNGQDQQVQDLVDLFREGEPDVGKKTSVLGRRSYIDDSLVTARSWDTLFNRVYNLLDACVEWNLSISVAKSFWGLRKVDYLGRKVSAEGMEAQPNDLSSLAGLPFPTTLRSMQSLLGSLNYHSRFIEDFAIYASILYELREADFFEASKVSKIKTAINLTGDDDEGQDKWVRATEAFTVLKNKIINAPILQHFDPDREPVVIVYARKWVISVALAQEHDGIYYPVTFTSRTLKANEINYGIVDKEMLALLRLLDICYTQLVTRSIKVFDAPLDVGVADEFCRVARPVSEDGILGVMAASITPREEINPIVTSIAPRKQPRQIISMPPPTVERDEELLVVSFDGSARVKRNGGAFSAIVWSLLGWQVISAASEDKTDLTRVANGQPAQRTVSSAISGIGSPGHGYNTITTTTQSRSIAGATGTMNARGSDMPSTGQRKWIVDLKKYLAGDVQDLSATDAKSCAKITEDYERSSEDRDLVTKLVIPETLQDDSLHHYHVSLESGHQGIGRTYQRVRAHFHWRGLYKSVQRYVGRQLRAVDLDRSFTGYAIAKASASRTAQTIAENYEECVFRRFGASEAIRHDREPGFMADVFRSFNKIVGQKQRATMAYRPQPNGTTERMVQTLTRSVKMYVSDVNQRDWDEYAERLTFALNMAQVRAREEVNGRLRHAIRSRADRHNESVRPHEIEAVRSFPDRPGVRLAIEDEDRLDFDEGLLPEDSWDAVLADDEYDVERIADMRSGRLTRYGRTFRDFLVYWKGPTGIDLKLCIHAKIARREIAASLSLSERGWDEWLVGGLQVSWNGGVYTCLYMVDLGSTWRPRSPEKEVDATNISALSMSRTEELVTETGDSHSWMILRALPVLESPWFGEISDLERVSKRCRLIRKLGEPVLRDTRFREVQKEGIKHNVEITLALSQRWCDMLQEQFLPGNTRPASPLTPLLVIGRQDRIRLAQCVRGRQEVCDSQYDYRCRSRYTCEKSGGSGRPKRRGMKINGASLLSTSAHGGVDVSINAFTVALVISGSYARGGVWNSGAISGNSHSETFTKSVFKTRRSIWATCSRSRGNSGIHNLRGTTEGDPPTASPETGGTSSPGPALPELPDELPQGLAGNPPVPPTSMVGGAGAGMGEMGMGGANPEMMTQMMQSPLFQAALDQVTSNPEQFLAQMEAMNPQMAAMMNANPQMRQMMANPEFLRQAMNPQNLQAMMQMQNAMNQLRGAGLMPGLEGLNLGDAGATGAGAAGSPNPAAANPFAMFGGFPGAGFGGAATGAASTPAAPAGNPEEIYASQLTQLNDMGFSNRDQNIRALQATLGNVHAAVERLLSGSI
ncbi:hypothetical protein ON010_g3835 [Phytophthora cinnamomi]|nr:hypothetical protein ON010_g3835 [Phytophthora cinnamomi]